MIRNAIALLMLTFSLLFSPSHAEDATAPVEARVPFAPSAFEGSDGQTHLAYELHITNFYGDTGPLMLRTLRVYDDDTHATLASFNANDLSQISRPAPADHTPVSIPPGKRIVLYVWITFAKGAVVPHTLRHRVEFTGDKQSKPLLDGALVTVNSTKAVLLGPPLHGGHWLAHEGPGNAHSHHWGSLVAVNGDLTIPQRYALDLVGVDDHGHALRAGTKDLQKSTRADWVGDGADVLAVADGVVRSARDGEQEHAPLSPQPEPTSLTANGLFGNYVVVQIEPGVFAAYAHLQRGSVRVKAGDHVRKGQLLAKLGESGNAAAPHLHFQLANAATFEGSEGIPYVFERFDTLGPETEAQLFGQGEPWKSAPVEQHQAQLPLNDVVIRFADR